MINSNRTKTGLCSIFLYQRTKDESVLDGVFKNRIPTLRYWAAQHYFPGLDLSIEDFYSELVIVFVKAIDGYKLNRGSFNTCLYTFLSNRIKNIKAGKYAKKRQPEFYDGSLTGMVLSLDMPYEEKNGKTITLGEKLEDEDSRDYEKMKEEEEFEDTVKILSDGNPKLKEIFIKLSEGNSISSLMREYKIKEGELKIDVNLAEKINCSANECDEHSEKIVIDKIKEKHGNNFKLIDFKVHNDIVKYKVEMRKTEESDLFFKTIRNLKKNKDSYVKLIQEKKEKTFEC